MSKDKEEHDFSNFFHSQQDASRKPTLIMNNKVSFNDEIKVFPSENSSPEFGLKSRIRDDSIRKLSALSMEEEVKAKGPLNACSSKLTFKNLNKNSDEDFEETENELTAACKITDLEIQSNKQVELVDAEGSLIAEKSLLINAGGLSKGGLRKTQDGWVYFGPIKRDKQNKVVNDYILNIQCKSKCTTVFKINFSRLDNKYYLCCDHSEDELVIIFMKLESPFVSK